MKSIIRVRGVLGAALVILVGAGALDRFKNHPQVYRAPAEPNPQSEIASAGAPTNQWSPALLDVDNELYLPDYSVAGYRWGDDSLPRPYATLDVSDFGAVPDDDQDDTEAFRRALAAAEGNSDYSVIRIPEGRFLIRDVLFIERGKTILRGSGSGEGGTNLYVDRPLNRMPAMAPTSRRRSHLSDLEAYISENALSEWGSPYSLFSWKGGVIWIEPPAQEANAACVAAQKHDVHTARVRLVGGLRGDTILSRAPGSLPPPHGVYRLQWFNPDGADGSFLQHVLGAHDLDIGKRLYETPHTALISQPVTVLETRGRSIILREPLLHDIQPEWTPVLVPVRYQEEVGIENLSIEFPPSDPARHHREPGYNGIYARCAAHSWVRDVHIRNADSAFIIEQSRQMTFTGVSTSGRSGHHSVHIEESYGIAVLDVDFRAPARHHPSFSTRTALSVVSGGHVYRARLDQHGGLNEQNLFDDLVLTGPDPQITCGGSSYWKPAAGRFTTFWNIRIDNGPFTDRPGSCSDAPEARFVGVRSIGSFMEFRYGPQAYVERLNQSGISVPSLYAYQRALRERRGPSGLP